MSSPNHGDRRGTNAPDMVVIHYTGMADAASARDRLCDPSAEVSAHWLIDECGRTEALVPEHRRAWHAGAGSWQGRDDVNSHSIGIELANPGDRPFPEPQMAALQTLLAGILARWSIPPARVIAHSDMAPDRKSDPGPRFDWARLGRLGLALDPAADRVLSGGMGISTRPKEAEAAPDLPTLLDQIGYPAGDAARRLAAFRMRFAPWMRGEEGSTDSDLAGRVLAALYAAPAPEPLMIYKVLRADEWAALERDTETLGAPVDLADGYVHFSTAEQLRGTLDKHFAGAEGLRLLTCPAAPLSPDLRWEASRGGALFPHLYRALRISDVARHAPIPLQDGQHQLEGLL